MEYRVKVYKTQELNNSESDYVYSSDDLYDAIDKANKSKFSVVFGNMQMKYVKLGDMYIRPLTNVEAKDLAQRLSVIVAKIKALGFPEEGIICDMDGIIYLNTDSFSIKATKEGKILGVFVAKQKVDLKGEIEMLTRYFTAFIRNLFYFPVVLDHIYFHGEKSLYNLNVDCIVEKEGLVVNFK